MRAGTKFSTSSTRAAKCKEEKGSNHTVHRILRHRFNRRTRCVRLIELRRIAPDNVADVLPRRRKISLDQQRMDVLPRLCEHTRRNTEVEQDHANKIRPPRYR